MSNSLKLVSAPVRESRLWDIPGYVPWFTADSATAIGVALRYLAVSLIGYKLTGSTTAAGWLGSLAAIAQQAAAVFGGTFADRHDRKTLIIVNATAGVICWGSVAALLMAGKLVFPVLLAIAVFESAVNGFLGPASDAMLKSIVDIRSYPAVTRPSTWPAAQSAACCTASPRGCRSCRLRSCTCWQAWLRHVSESAEIRGTAAIAATAIATMTVGKRAARHFSVISPKDGRGRCTAGCWC